MQRRGGAAIRREPLLTRAVSAVFCFVRIAEFEILFFLFFVIAFLIFKDLVSLWSYLTTLIVASVAPYDLNRLYFTAGVQSDLCEEAWRR
ncbi:hypothetical protein ZIOFF_055671 [Zingiber officinale]|uniref:Uncharacterized protein n=1 Tax=Zingiber officinale TaxID=94328 RepID=A0A8J5FFD8_ZINOF|nr:hypothetical protein ZIOFF_055671 [Zingiber officinale]